MKNIAYSVDPSVQTDLFVCQFGEEACSPSYAFGPHTRDHVLIHFVASGCGVLYCDGQAYPVASGQGFLILPGEETLYQADSVTPWHYAWVGYRGSQAESLTRSAGLSEHHRVFTATDPAKAWNALTLMQEDARSLRLIQMAVAGDLLRFLSLIAPAQGTTAASPAQQPQQALRRHIVKRRCGIWRGDMTGMFPYRRLRILWASAVPTCTGS